jgi:hypothetical protein
MVDAAFTIENLHGPHGGMGDEHTPRGQMHVSVIEPARRMAGELY